MVKPASADYKKLKSCDIVMKGGVTSGVVYPRAAVELAKKYRFRQVGGSSAGAIAAVMVAATELGRRRWMKSGVGKDPFLELNELPTELGDSLSSLFQPSVSTTVPFDALMHLQEPDRSTFRKILVIARLLVRRALGWFILGFVVAMVPAFAFDVALLGTPATGDEWWAVLRALLIWIPVAIVAGLVASAFFLVVKAKSAICKNGFGICNGHTKRMENGPPPLTDWMEKKLRQQAGRDDGSPVTFGDLWGRKATKDYRKLFDFALPGCAPRINYKITEAELKPAHRRKLLKQRARRKTDCVVMTTDLSHRRPYRFPFDTQDFFWCEKCLTEYFPENVVEQMRSTTIPVDYITVGEDADKPVRIPAKCSWHHEHDLYYMPLAPDIPVVIAARLSLSFPGLISAVPFQAVDWARSPAKRCIVPVWFSDGGICSNFPMRFFDSAWPSWPTFGINLSPPHPDSKELVWRAKPTASGPTSKGSLSRHFPITSLGGFFRSILDTMQNWNDTAQIKMPGFRDRIVVVGQRADEGGMNLKMAAGVVEELADRGAEAARNIVFGGPKSEPFDFKLHRWIRYRVSMPGLGELLCGMHDTWDSGMSDIVAENRVKPIADMDGNPVYKAKDKDRQATTSLMKTAKHIKRLDNPATKGEVPSPRSEVRLVPPL